MASEQELDEIRRRVDIVDMIGHYVTPKKAGANYKALCPFHQEKTPSMMISPEKQIFKCFGCNEGGDIFGFMMKIENLTFPEAVQMLADRAGVQLTPYKSEQYDVPNHKNLLYEINRLSSKFYQTILTQHPAGKAALEYLHSRGIKDETIKLFGIGFAPTQKVLGDFLQKRGFSQKLIEEAGSPDKFFRRIIFPIYDAIGNVIALMGRVYPEGMPKYLNTGETALFHKGRALYGLHLAKGEIKKLDFAVLVEGQMDVVASHQSGVVNVVASSGTAFTPQHLYILSRYSQNFVLAFDNDSAGIAATEKMAQMAIEEGYSVKIVQMPKNYKDAGEVIEKEPESWPVIVNGAIPAMDWYFAKAEALIGKKSGLTGDDKKKFTNYLLPIIAKMPHEVEKAHYVKQIAEKVGVKEDVIQRAISKYNVSGSSASNDSQTANSDNESKSDELEDMVLANFINNPVAGRDFHAKLDKKYFTNKSAVEIAMRLKKWYNIYEDNKDKTSAAVISELRRGLGDEENSYLDKVLNTSFKYRLDDSNEELIKEEIKNSLLHLQQNRREQEKDEFALKIAEAEKAGNREKVKELLKDLQKFLIKEE